MKKLILAALVCVTASLAHAAEPSVADRYAKTCALCHASGAANAPKTAVVTDWAPRLEKGMEALVQSVNNGLNAMPPKGMCMDCTADDFKALIEYMSAAQ